MIYVWHYTIIDYLPGIHGYGLLLPSNACAEDEMPMLWFSGNQLWEPTAAKPYVAASGRLVTPSTQEVFEQGRAIRFGLPRNDVRLLAWRAACKFAGTPRRMREAMERVGIEQGAKPTDWFASAEGIYVHDLQFQVFRGGKWNGTDLQISNSKECSERIGKV